MYHGDSLEFRGSDAPRESLELHAKYLRWGRICQLDGSEPSLLDASSILRGVAKTLQQGGDLNPVFQEGLDHYPLFQIDSGKRIKHVKTEWQRV